jgi:endonuclease YncB( thermonuclease family)
MSKNKVHECPKCSKISFTQIKPNVFKCFACDHHKDLNDPDFKWLPIAIAVGSCTGLIGIAIGIFSFNQILPNRSTNTPSPSSNQIAAASMGAEPAQAEPKANSQQKPKAIAKAISGNQVVLEINGKPQEVILCGLNAPMPNSPLFAAATQNLQQLLNRTGADNLMLTAIADSNGTPIVELYDRRENISLNAHQVASGYTTSSQFLAKPCRDRAQILAKVQEAQAQQKGLWQP